MRVRKELIIFSIYLLFAAVLFSTLTYYKQMHSDSHGFQSFWYLLNRENYFENNQIGLWTNRFGTGSPYLGHPETPIFDISWLISLFVRDSLIHINLVISLYMMMSMSGTYYLVFYITRNRKSAFISGLTIFSSGFFLSWIGALSHTNAMGYIPFILLFLFKALDNDKGKWIENMLFSALFMSGLILSGAIMPFGWLCFLVLPTVVIFEMVRARLRPTERLVKTFIIVLFMFLASIFIAAFKILPVMEYIQLSSRQFTQSYNDFVFHGIREYFQQNLLYNIAFRNVLIRIEMVSLMILAVTFIFFTMSLKNKINISYYFFFAFSGVLLLFLFASDSFITKIVYAIPVINSFRGIEKSLVLLPFFLAIIVGISFNWLQSKVRVFARKEIPLAIILIVLAEFLILVPKVKAEYTRTEEIEESNILKELDLLSSKELFRVHKMGSSFVGPSICPRVVYSNIYISDWCTGNAWFDNFVQFTVLAESPERTFLVENIPDNFAKMRALLNDKYIVSSVNLSGRGKNSGDIKGLEFVGSYYDVPGSIGYGQYLYENKEFLPRFYVVEKAVLLLGERQKGKYVLLDRFMNDFDARDYALVLAAEVDKDALEDYDLIVPFQEAREEYKEELDYIIKKNPEKVFPSPAYNSTLPEVLDQLRGGFHEVVVNQYTPEKIILQIPDNITKGHLIMSEQFYHFDGWQAEMNGRRYKLMNTFDVISSFSFSESGPKTVVLRYIPWNFYLGVCISFMTILAVLVFLSRKKGKALIDKVKRIS